MRGSRIARVGACLAVVAAGCRVGPRYARPRADLPREYRFASDSTRVESLGDVKWTEVFRDQELQKLIGRALEANYDIHVAAARVLQARAQLTITRADQFPTVTADATATEQRTPASSGAFKFPAATFATYRAVVQASWQADFWGRFRSATEAQRATLLATEWAERAVLVSVVSQVALSYFTLRELDLELEIGRRALTARQESVRLTRTLEAGGVATLLDVRQAEQLEYTAESVITNTERLIAQQEDAIDILLAKNPGPIPRGLALVDQPSPPEVPAGLPSALLARRPDIRQAEQTLIAANARIGVAKAQLFPQITLTADAGFQSNALSQFISGPATLWSLSGDLLQQVFNAGRLKANVRLTEAQKQELVATYQKTVTEALREVSDALIGHRKAYELRQELTELVASTQDAVRLSDIRYRGGFSSYLEVLTSQTSLLNAELTLAQARLGELLSIVQLYAALGGGWQQ